VQRGNDHLPMGEYREGLAAGLLGSNYSGEPLCQEVGLGELSTRGPLDYVSKSGIGYLSIPDRGGRQDQGGHVRAQSQLTSAVGPLERTGVTLQKNPPHPNRIF